MNLLDQITLVLGVDAAHLEELRWVWPTWMAFRQEILRMRLVVFYNPSEIDPNSVDFINKHPNVKWVPWQMSRGLSARETMLTGWIHVPAREVETKWYLKLDTDVVATADAGWIRQVWFRRYEGKEPVFISSSWNYSKPRYVMNLLDDWADKIAPLASYPRLDLRYDVKSNRVAHRRVISWIFFGLTEWTREVAGWLGSDGRLPHPSQDTFLFYCAKRSQKHYVRIPMRRYKWSHVPLRTIKETVSKLGFVPEVIT